MTRFMDKSFSVMVGGDEDYRNRWEATFGQRRERDQPCPSENSSGTPSGLPSSQVAPSSFCIGSPNGLKPAATVCPDCKGAGVYPFSGAPCELCGGKVEQAAPNASPARPICASCERETATDWCHGCVVEDYQAQCGCLKCVADEPTSATPRPSKERCQYCGRTAQETGGDDCTMPGDDHFRRHNFPETGPSSCKERAPEETPEPCTESDNGHRWECRRCGLQLIT